MEAAGFALALVATADLCLKYGKLLADACKSTEHADKEVREMLLVVQTLWIRIEDQLLKLRNISEHLPEAHSVHQNLLLAVLRGHLEDVRSKVEKLLANLSLRRRMLYAFIIKDSLEKSIQNLEKWYHRWDPTWLMLARVNNPHVDRVIRQESHHGQSRHAPEVVGGLLLAHRAIADSDHRPFAFLPANVGLMHYTPIAHSKAALAIRSDDNSFVITDVVKFVKGVGEKDMERDVRALARVLSQLDPQTCNLLSCKAVKRNVIQGMMSRGELEGFSFLFGIPPMFPNRTLSKGGAESTPYPPQDIRSLRDFLINSHDVKSLTFRLKIAKSIARSVINLHSAQFVHKSIRPETVLVTPYGDSYLVGFERFRATMTMTTLAGDNNWEENLYRHPERQGKAPEQSYIMQHDVYSLGICLLEIGMWETFVTYPGSIAQPGMDGLAPTESGRSVGRGAYATKEWFTQLAIDKLPSRMGEKYLEVVISCLTCLDADSKFSPVDNFNDEQGIDVGFRYIDKILNELEDITL